MPFLFLILFSLAAAAVPVRVSWEIGPAQVGVNYRVVRLIDGSEPMPLGETSAASLVVEALPGDQLAVVAFNELGTAEPSAPIQIPADPKPETPMVKVHVYQVSDLKHRRIVATLYVERKQADFFQLGIETP